MGRQCPRWGRRRKKRPVTRGPPGAAHRRGGPAHAGSLRDALTPRSADIRSISSLFTRMRWLSITVIQTPKQIPFVRHQRVISEQDCRARREPPSPTRATRTVLAQRCPPGSALEPSDGGGGCGDPVGGEAPWPCARLCSPRGPGGHSGSGAKSKDSREPETALPRACHKCEGLAPQDQDSCRHGKLPDRPPHTVLGGGSREGACRTGSSEGLPRDPDIRVLLDQEVTRPVSSRHRKGKLGACCLFGAHMMHHPPN